MHHERLWGVPGRRLVPRRARHDRLPLAAEADYGPRGTRVGRYVRYNPDDVRAWFVAQGSQTGWGDVDGATAAAIGARWGDSVLPVPGAADVLEAINETR